MTDEQSKRLDEINKQIANGNLDPRLFNERSKLLGITGEGKVNCSGKHLAGWRVKK